MTDFVTIKTYVTLNEQVTLQNQDPVKIKAGLKPTLIDLEAYGMCYGDKGQGRGLRIMFQRMQVKSRIKFSRLFQTGLPYLKAFMGYFVGSDLVSICLSKLNHVFTVPSFDSKVWNYLFAKVQKPVSRGNPRENFSFESFSRCSTSSCRICTTENCIQPIDQNFFGVINFKNSSVMLRHITIPLFFGYFCYEEASFSINNSCHIRQINWFIGSCNIILRSSVIFSSCFFHRILDNLIQYYYISIHESNILVQAERLNERGLDLPRHVIV
jgi:hypothetical protein